MDKPASEQLIPNRKVRERYGVTSRTIKRWEEDPNLNFPKPTIINNRKYQYESVLTEWERSRARGA
jgi:hypothetical protein